MKIQFLGHAGFRLSFKDPSDESVERVIYIDTWEGNPKFPEEMKGKLNDADLILITHGHFDHSGSAAQIAIDSIENGKNPQIYCNFEIMHWLLKTTKVPEANVSPANKGCPLDFGFARVVMTPADHSSGCPGGEDHEVIYGGDPAGFVIDADGVSLYHGGDTACFTDMTIISELYEPTYALVPIGGRFTMGPKEAAYALHKFLKSVKVCIPMHFDTFPLLKGETAPDELLKELEGFGHELTVVNPYTFQKEAAELSFH